jgi:hypothetical protein
MFGSDARNRRSHLSAFLILLLLLSTFVAVPHYHFDTADHHECPICVVSHHQPATGQTTAAYDVSPCFTESTFAPASASFSENVFTSSLNSRAPPA